MRRAITLLVLSVAIVAAPLGAEAAPPTTKTHGVGTTAFAAGIDGATVSGLLEGWTSSDGWQRGSADLWVWGERHQLECYSLGDASVVVDPKVEDGSLQGTLYGTCWDFQAEQELALEVTLDITWTGAGEITRERVAGPRCHGEHLIRRATSVGRARVSIPERGIDVTGATEPGVDYNTLVSMVDVCANPGAPA